jgi:hypothetical protein
LIFHYWLSFHCFSSFIANSRCFYAIAITLFCHFAAITLITLMISSYFSMISLATFRIVSLPLIFSDFRHTYADIFRFHFHWYFHFAALSFSAAISLNISIIFDYWLMLRHLFSFLII